MKVFLNDSIKQCIDFSEYKRLLEKMYNSLFITNTLENADIVIIGGQGDISPYLYGNETSFFDTKHSYSEHQDLKDIYIFNECQRYQIPIIGINRGAYFLTAMAGGIIIEEINGHDNKSQEHAVISDKSEVFFLESSHNKMMYPYILDNNEYKIIAHTPEKLSTFYKKGEYSNTYDMINKEEPEIIHYYDINSLAIQSNIQKQASNEALADRIKSIINRTILKKNESSVNLIPL